MLTCCNVQNIHSFSNTVHYCRSSRPRLSQMLHFTKSLLPTSTVCSDWPTDPVHCDWPNTTSHVGNVMPLSIIAFKIKVKTVFNILSFTISSNPRGEQSHVTDTVMMLVCVCKQATIKTISDGLYTPLWCDPVSLSHTHKPWLADVLWCGSLSYTHTHIQARAHTHTHTRCAKLRIWTVIRKYLNY